MTKLFIKNKNAFKNENSRMMDEISIKILNILQEKARIPNVEVARQVGMAPSAVLERIRKLEKQGIIEGYEVRLNPKKFDRSLIAFMKLKVDTSKDHTNIENRLFNIPDIQEVHYISGDDGYLIKIRASDTKYLEKLIKQSILNIDGVMSTHTMIALSTIKETARIPIENYKE